MDGFWKTAERIRRRTVMNDLSTRQKHILFTVIAGILIIGSLAYHFHSYECMKKTSQIKSARESYQFDLNNDVFIGSQNDQEMGDYQICFYGNIETFSGLVIGKGVNDDVWKEWLQITNEKVSVYDVESQTVTSDFSHNLKFKDYIAVNIQARLDGTAKVEVLTNGGSFSREEVLWTGRNGRLFVDAAVEGEHKTILKNCSLSYYCNGWNKSIWMYGDSYFSLTEKDRWTTYLIENGASNILLSGRSGEGSEESLEAFKTQLQYGNPKTVVWCVGMNDGDDEKNINPEYKKCLDEVVSICKENEIELILATIPTCSAWCNDYKNEYIKSLDYTVIDFAEAVGSYDVVTWRDKMLEEGEDRIHPTDVGALAMYSKAVATIPELLSKQ